MVDDAAPPPLRLLRLGAPGNEQPAVLTDQGQLLDASGHVTDYDEAFLRDRGTIRLRELVESGVLPEVADPGARIGPCVARPRKIVCVGLNYGEHAREAGMDIPAEPVLFFKATNTICGPHDPIHIPPGAEKTDWEVELGVVIGKEARYLVDEGAAAAAIAGYAAVNDVSERAFQLERGGQWVKGKSCETFNPIGPWFVPAEDVADVLDLTLELRVNGERVQHSSTSDMLFSPPHIVWYVSQFMVLEPGDVINTGTPSGVGMGLDPPRFLRAGDVVELEVQGLGCQRQDVIDAPR